MPEFRRALALVLSLATAVLAQTAAPLRPEVLRAFTPHVELLSRLDRLAEESARLKRETYGQSVRGRPLVTYLATSPRNHARLRDLERRYQGLKDPRTRRGPIDTTDLPVIIWLSYNVHGNEPSPSEAALDLLTRLATAEDAETLRWLEEALIIVDPCLNPDGRERYLNWYLDQRGAQPDPEPQAMEHLEPWPGGRPNHYLFDLNRDWAFATQVETRARLPHLLRYSPQVHVDFHEMGYEQDYFFFPAAPPIHALVPESLRRFGEVFGRGNAAAFDAQGWSYYTAEDFDLFFPGYGDSWPTMTGAVGMTYEQGGHSRAGQAVRRRSGEILTLTQRVAHHLVASEATIATAVAEREALLLEFARFRESSVALGREGPVRAILLPEGEDARALDALVETLLVQGLEVHRLRETTTLEAQRPAFGGEARRRRYPAGSALVRLDQPLGRLARALLEPRAALSVIDFYDIAAWSLPFAFGLEAFESETLPEATERILSAPRRTGAVLAGDAKVGYLLEGQKSADFQALARFLAEGLDVRVATEAFVLNGRPFQRGSLYLRRREATSRFDERVRDIATETGAVLIPASTGFTEEGVDLGSSKVRPIAAPRIAIFGGEGVGTNNFGATRFLLDQEISIAHSALPLRGLGAADLAGFTAVVLPGGRITDSGFQTLQAFAENGGVVIAFEDAAFSLCGKERLPVLEAKRESKPEQQDPQPLDEQARLRREKAQPGSIFALDLDPAHPIAFGVRGEATALLAGTQVFDERGPGIPVARLRKGSALSGYVNPEDEAYLAGKSLVTVFPRGRGAFVLFATDPNFRGVWKSTGRLFLNAALLLPSPRTALR